MSLTWCHFNRAIARTGGTPPGMRAFGAIAERLGHPGFFDTMRTEKTVDAAGSDGPLGSPREPQRSQWATERPRLGS